MGLARDKANFYSMLASMAQAGLGLRQCFGLSSFPYRLRPAARSICELLDAGVPLPEAMHRQSVFTAFECNLVSVGVASGTLDATFSTLSQWFTDSHQFRAKSSPPLRINADVLCCSTPGRRRLLATGLSLTTDHPLHSMVACPCHLVPVEVSWSPAEFATLVFVSYRVSSRA